jgi:hypothetical protein
MPTESCRDDCPDRPECLDGVPDHAPDFWRGLAVMVPLAILLWAILAILALALWRIVL